jgi:hypothetical protein
MSNLVNNFYPKKQTEQQVKRKIMREAFMKDYNVKQIAAYFRVSLFTVYLNLNVRKLKVKKAEQRLLKTNDLT